MSSNEKANGNDDSSDVKVTKVRKCPSWCIITQIKRDQKQHRQQSIVWFAL